MASVVSEYSRLSQLQSKLMKKDKDEPEFEVYASCWDFLGSLTWLQVPIIGRTLDSGEPSFVQVLHNKECPHHGTVIGVFNLDDLSLYRSVAATYPGNTIGHVSHLCFMLSPAPVISEKNDAGLDFGKDLLDAAANICLLAETLPFRTGPLHPFHILRSQDSGRLTFFYRLTVPPDVR